MIVKDEFLFVVDENNKPQKPQSRSFVHQNKLWHRTTGIWVIDNYKKILCQKRSLKKDLNPGVWMSSFGGHVGPNEEYAHNAAQEVSEELRLNISEEGLISYKVLCSDKPAHKEFQGIFALILNNQNQLEFEKDEIDQLKWLDFDEVRNILVHKREDNWIKKSWDEDVLNWLQTLVTTP